MMEKLLTEELLKQIKLINYDRGKTILEQNESPKFTPVWNNEIQAFVHPAYSEYLDVPKQFVYQKDRYGTFSKLYPNEGGKISIDDPEVMKKRDEYLKDENEKRRIENNSKIIFEKLKYELSPSRIGKTLTNFDEQKIVDIIKMINQENYGPILLLVLKEGYSSIMDYVMTAFDKPSEWSEDHKNDNNEDDFSLWQQGGIEKYTNYYNNDKYVFKISDHLWNFRDTNSIEGNYNVREENEPDLAMDSPGTRMGTNEELAEIAHWVLPIASLILTMGASSWAVMWLATGIEIGDAAIYQFVNKDPYMAGLGLVFAFAGPADKFLAPLIKKYGKSILIKFSKRGRLGGGELTAEEMGIMRYVNANKVKLLALTIKNMIKKYIKEFVMNVKSVKILVGFIIWLVKKGFMLSKNFTSFGMMVGGSFYTWDKIASVLGLCNTAPLEELKESDYKILQLIGSTGPYLQPFTKGCFTEDGKKIFEEADKMLNNNRIIMQMDEMINNNFILSTEYSKYKMIETILLQTALKYFGFSYFIPDDKKVDKNVEKGNVWNKEKCLSQFTAMSIDVYKISQHPECVKYLEPTKPISKEHEKLLKSKPINDPNYKVDYGLKKEFNWGYYDEQTEKMVKEFQKKYNLTVDGKAGKETFKKIKELVNELGEIPIPDYSKFSWTQKEVEKLRKKMYDELKKRKEDLGIMDITPEEIQKSFEKQRQTIVNDLEKANSNINTDFKDTDLEELQNQIDNLNKQDNY